MFQEEDGILWKQVLEPVTYLPHILVLVAKTSDEADITPTGDADNVAFAGSTTCAGWNKDSMAFEFSGFVQKISI